MKRLLFICFLIWACLEVSGQSKLSPYTRKYLAESEKIQPGAARVKTMEYIPAYIHVTPDIDLSLLEKLGVKINLYIAGIVTAQIPSECIRTVADMDNVTYLQVAVPVRPMMDKVRAATGVDKVQGGEGLPGGFFGKGVVVGVIDAGFDYTHPDFYDWDRKELRIKRVWEQSYAQGTPPDGFSYGGELKTKEEILKAAGDVTTNSHGTHVAGIAAGADKLDNDYYGVAGEADIVLVSMGELMENNVNLTDAIAYIYKYAESVGKPCVINMSLGTQSGPHDGTSAFDVIADQLQGEGCLLVGSVGNFGADKFHISKTFVSADDEPLKTFVDYKSRLSVSNVGGEIEIWGESGMDYSVEVFTYNLSKHEKTDAVTIDISAAEGISQEYKLTGATGSIQLFSEVSPLNDKPHVMLSSQITGLRANHAIGLQVIPHTAGIVHVWGDDVHVELTSNELEGWLDGNNDLSLAEIGGTGKNIISVGAFVTRNSFQVEGSDKVYPLEETMDAIASFSSKGPTADGRIKPEITAPGCYIASAVSSHDASLGSQNIARHGTWNDVNYYYAFMQGTSMSAPVVAGIIATWLQANPKLTPNDIREILKKTAVQDSHTGELPEEGNPTWGNGKIDAWKGIKESLSMASSINEVSASLPETVLVKKEKNIYNLLFAKDASAASYAVYSISGQVVYMQPASSLRAGEELSVNFSVYPKGMYIIRINTADWQCAYKVIVE